VTEAGVLVGPRGERFYTAQVLAAALGISVKEVEQLAARGYIQPPEIRFGSKKVWPEFQVARLLRESKAGGGWVPYR
jgi:hypothetical protein